MTLQRFLVPNPAAGHDWVWVVPGEYNANLISVSAQLVATTNPATSTDQSGNGHNLAYNPAMYAHEVFGATGPFGGGGGLAVDCRNYDSLSNQWLGQASNAGGAFDVPTFSWEAIINPANTGNVFQVVGLINNPIGGGLVRCGMGIDRGGGNIHGIASTSDIPSLGLTGGTGVWSHIVATYDGAQWIGYLNGVGYAAVAGHAPTLTQLLRPLSVMGDGFSGEGVNGFIAALAYFSGALAPANVANHFNAIATSAAAYQTAVLVDTPLAFWMLADVQTHFQRTAILTLTDGTSVIAKYPGFAPTQQSNVFQWTWSVDGSGAAQNATQTVTIVPITPTTLPPGYTVGVTTVDLNAFDQWQNVVIWADVTPSGQGGGGTGGLADTSYLNALLVPDYSHRNLAG